MCCVAKPVLLIPSPNVAENHQYHNAMALAVKQAAVVIEERDLEQTFEKEFKRLSSNPVVLSEMQEALQKLAKTNAATRIVEQIEALL